MCNKKASWIMQDIYFMIVLSFTFLCWFIFAIQRKEWSSISKSNTKKMSWCVNWNHIVSKMFPFIWFFENFIVLLNQQQIWLKVSDRCLKKTCKRWQKSLGTVVASKMDYHCIIGHLIFIEEKILHAVNPFILVGSPLITGRDIPISWIWGWAEW